MAFSEAMAKGGMLADAPRPPCKNVGFRFPGTIGIDNCVQTGFGDGVVN